MTAPGTPSGTYSTNPWLSDILLLAFQRIQIRPAEITSDHVTVARQELNFSVLPSWANRGVNLWKIDLQTVSIPQGTATVTLPAGTVNVLDAFIRTTTGGIATDLPIVGIARTDYAAIPSKAQQGRPTSFWLNRQAAAPIISLWPVPDAGGPYTLGYYRLVQVQDAEPDSGQTADVPYRFLAALVADLTAHLAVIYRPAQAEALFALAKIKWDEAASEDRELAPMRLSPDTSAYFQ